MITRIVLAAAVAISGFSASAAPHMFACDVTDKHRNHGWIADKMVFVVGADGKVTVIDPIIQHLEQDPMIAKVVRNSDKDMKLRWVLRDVKNGSSQTTDRFTFVANIDKKKNSVAVYAQPYGYPNRFRARGTCELRTDGKLPASFR